MATLRPKKDLMSWCLIASGASSVMSEVRPGGGERVGNSRREQHE